MANNNKHTGSNVPALRFPEFSGEWEKVKLGDSCTFFSGGTPSSSRKEYYCGEIPFIRSGEIHSDSTALSITKEAFASCSAKMVNKGDLLLALYGATSGDISISRINGAINQAILCIRPKHLNAYFIKSLWESHKKQILETYLQGGQGNLSSEIIKNISFIFPNIEEQNKISELVRKIDKRIETQSKIIEEQETLLKSLADKLISAQLANVALCECVEAKASTMKESELDSSGEFPVYGASGLCGFCSDALEESDSILITKDGSGVGTCQYATEKHSFLGTLCSLTAKENVYLPYIYYALLNFNFASYKTGQAIPHIYFKDYGKATIYCPSYVEQIRIASGLKKLDAKINADIELLKQYRLQKEFLLSRMFI